MITVIIRSSFMKQFLLFTSLLIMNFFAHSTTIVKPPPGVSLHQLNNGINVLLIENHGLPMVGINTVVKVGSAYETFASSGMSHMLEHLLFNGTTQWSQKQLYDLTDKIGGYNNANTSEYYTNFMMVTPFENIEKGMQIQAGMLFDSILPEEKFEKEKGIVLEEIAKSLANPRNKAQRTIKNHLFAGHAISLPTLGTYETIKNMNRDNVMAFYKNNYVPNNMEISVIGNFNSEEMLKTLNTIYGKAKPNNVIRPTITDWATGFEALPHKSQEQVLYTYTSKKDITLRNFYSYKSFSSEFDSLLMDVLDKNKETIESQLKNTYKEFISLSFDILSYPAGQFIQADITINEDKNIDNINKRFNQLMTEQKLFLPASHIKSEAIKTKTDFLKNIEKPHMFGIYNADLIAQQGLVAIINQFSGNSFFEAGKKLTQLKFDPQPLTIIDYPKPVLSKIERKQSSAKVLITKKNDATIITKQNELSELLAIHYLFKHKNKFEEKYGKDAAKIWHDLFGKKMKSVEVQKYIADFGLTFTVNDNPYFPMDDIYLSPLFGYIRVEGLASNSQNVIEFLNKQMLNFKPSRQAFETELKKSSTNQSHIQKNKSKALFNKHYTKILFGENENNISNTKLTYENFIDFGERYFTPSNIIISVVSKHSPDEIKSYFSEFTKESEVPFSGRAQSKHFIKNDTPININETIGSEQAQTFYGYIKEVDEADKSALTVLSLLLKSDIAFNIREKQGLAYRMSSGIEIKEDKALFYIKVPTQPKNVEKLSQQFAGLLTSSFASKITQDKLEKTVNKYLGRMMFRRLSSINQAYYLAHSLYFEGSIKTDKQQLDALKNVKLEDVKNVAKKYLVAQNPIQIIIN